MFICATTGISTGIVVANHQYEADWWFMMLMARFLGLHGHLRIIVPESLRHVPILGWVSSGSSSGGGGGSGGPQEGMIHPRPVRLMMPLSFFYPASPPPLCLRPNSYYNSSNSLSHQLLRGPVVV